MNKLSFSLLCQVYLLLLLLVAAILSSWSYSLLALILIVVLLFTTFRPLLPRYNILIMLTTIFLIPLILDPLVNYPADNPQPLLTVLQLIAAIAVLPAIYLLDYALRQNAQNMSLARNTEGRHVTSISRAIFIATLAILLVSLILDNPVLLFTSIMLTLYLLAVLARVLQAVPRQPLDIPAIWKRIIADTTGSVSRYATSRAAIRVHCLLGPLDSWVRITPQRFTLSRDQQGLDLTITPPLSGPTHPQLQASVIDLWGFIQVDQVIEPVELHVIPRARYAEWLAVKYLEQAGAGTAATTLPSQEVLMPRGRGVEYFGSRSYQPGDQLKDIDWKHTLKLSQIIIKEHIEAGEQAAIIAVNLSVADAEEADKLAFNLITTALTLARQAIPIALAAYNHERVILTTTLTDPQKILRQTLLLVKDITVVEFAHRFLQPPDISRLRRTITQLKQATSEPAQRLLSMLDFEYRALEEAAKNNPATLALLQVTTHTPAPAVILSVSQLNHDAETLPVTVDRLSRRGFTTIPIAAAGSNLPRW